MIPDDLTPTDADREAASGHVEGVIDTLSDDEDFDERHMLAAYLAGRLDERRRAAGIASNPYGDEVEAMGPDEPLAVGAKIAAAILRGPTS